MSFTAGTRVLLASGATIAISQLKPGEKLLATNVKTGKTSAETVTAVLVHHDTDRYDLRILTAHGTAVIQTTSSHLFWDPASHRWIKAAALHYGSNLSTTGSARVTLLDAYTPSSTSGWMWDLTVTSDHDFYIDVATRPSSSTTAAIHLKTPSTPTRSSSKCSRVTTIPSRNL
jgi:hypothetical protein